MADARTKLDILYHDVLGDINEVINRADQLTTRQERIVEQLQSQTEILPIRFASQARTEITPLIGEVKAAIAQASDNIEAGIVEGAATALVEVREVIDKLGEQASSYEAQSAEIEKGLSQLVSGFQKELNAVMQGELISLSNTTTIVRDRFRMEIVDNQTRALDAIAKAKKNQTWGMVWQLAFALGIAVIGGVIGSTIQLASIKDEIAGIQAYPSMEGVTMEGLTSRKTQ